MAWKVLLRWAGARDSENPCHAPLARAKGDKGCQPGGGQPTTPWSSPAPWLHHSPHHPRFSGSCQSAVRWAGSEESETGSIKAEPAAAPAAAPKATKRGLTERQARSQCSVIPTRVPEIWFFLSSWFFLFSCSGGLKEVCRQKNSRLLLPLWPHELCDLEQVTWVLWALL